MAEWVQAAGVIGAAVVALVLALAYLRSVTQRQAHAEAVQLADTRGERINDLETQVAGLQREVAELRGQVSALLLLKADEIAEAVATRMASQVDGRSK